MSNHTVYTVVKRFETLNNSQNYTIRWKIKLPSSSQIPNRLGDNFIDLSFLCVRHDILLENFTQMLDV